MKVDIIMFCFLATILGSTRHVIGFLAEQATAAGAAAANNVAATPLQQRRPSTIYAGGLGVGRVGSPVIQPRHSLAESQEPAAAYDPGDELLRALNAELAANGQELGVSPEEPDYADTVYNELEVASKFDMLKKLEDDLRAEQELVDKSAMLMKMLEDPTLDTLPLVYVEETAPVVEDYADLEEAQSQSVGKSKRGRYLRRYPWKRHNRNRGNYEPELRYACTPSKEDIFKLLVNLHENRKGNHSKTVNFCNRKRPAKAVFTNIRFLG